MVKCSLNIRMGKKGDLGGFEHDMIVSVRQVGLSISETHITIFLV